MDRVGVSRTYGDKQRVRERRKAMLRRRAAVLRNVLYVLSLGMCLWITWHLWGARTNDIQTLHSVVIWVSLAVALRASREVPFPQPRPRIAVGLAMAGWGLTLLHLALTARTGRSVAVVVLLAIGGLVLLRFFVSHLRQFTETRIWLGTLIAAAAMALAAWELSSGGTPEASRGIGITSGMTKVGEANPGLLMRLDVYPHGCSSVDAEARVFGTSEFWAKHPVTDDPIALQVFMPAGSAHSVQVFAETDSTAASDETQPGSFQPSPFPHFSGGHMDQSAPLSLPFRAGIHSVRNYGGYELVDAWVSGNWAEVKGPVTVRFSPSWLTSNGLESCYLQTPPLVGPLAWPDLESSIWRHINHGHLVLPASASVIVHNASYVAGSSRPEPTGGGAETLIWDCGISVGKGIEHIGASRSLLTYALKDYEKARMADCGEVTPLEERSARTLHDLLIFLVGGLVSLGLTVIVSGIPRSGDLHGQPRAKRGSGGARRHW